MDKAAKKVLQSKKKGGGESEKLHPINVFFPSFLFHVCLSI